MTERGAVERKFLPVAIGEVSPSGLFSGYASLFGAVDLGRDLVERGAFAKSLAARSARQIRMLFQHDPTQPIGVWEDISEDARGLRVRGRLSLESRKAREVHALMRSGALDGLSIGFRTAKARADPRTGIRHIVEADLWEISVVTFPMLPQARIDQVKSGASRRRKTAVINFTPTEIAAALRRASRLFRERNRTT